MVQMYMTQALCFDQAIMLQVSKSPGFSRLLPYHGSRACVHTGRDARRITCFPLCDGSHRGRRVAWSFQLPFSDEGLVALQEACWISFGTAEGPHSGRQPAQEIANATMVSGRGTIKRMAL